MSILSLTFEIAGNYGIFRVDTILGNSMWSEENAKSGTYTTGRECWCNVFEKESKELCKLQLLC